MLFIVQDKSGSMNFAPDGSTAGASNPSKWSIAQSVVPSLATNFSNRFRFGVEMFPGATTTFNCTTGTTVSAVSYSPSDVAYAYSQAVAGGGTPTATSLSGAKTYLQGLGLSTPAYVLLLTDGLPNCNLSLNPSTCTATTPGCANNSCGLGAKDCLDDNNTEAAAAALYAAGIKVFVVGFDSTLTIGNNKAVLDAIAAAGGTGSAYVATNQTQLTTALNQIALNTATCCQDVCTAGASVCTANGQQQTCALDSSIGCTTWTTQNCPNRSQCISGACQTCQDQCTLGALQCNNGSAQQCVTAADGCTVWTTSQNCGYGEICANGMCNSCMGCNIGDQRCGQNGLETCDWDVLSGCTQWVAGQCNFGSTCQGGNCVACNSTCTAGTTRCNGMTVETCVADPSGCTAWQSSQSCTNFCSGGACGTCGTSCNPGAVRCNGNGVETCGMDSNNCPVWNPSQNCGTNQFCTGGSCSTCATSCNQGDKRCAANGGIETCQLDASGVCTTWVTTGQCDQGEICSSGTCSAPCSDACSLGSAQCAANGTPQACQQGPAGCTVWIDQMTCDQGTVCYQGSCDATCSNSEVDDCPSGYQCTGTTNGNVCLPAGDGGTMTGSDAGTPATDGGSSHGADGGTATDPGTKLNGSGEPDPHTGDSGPVKAMPGCGCNGGIGLGAPLIGLLALALRRRRSR
ncbi:MAG: hypothetical protein QM723_38190 [Myxococcaceae bacterium]